MKQLLSVLVFFLALPLLGQVQVTKGVQLGGTLGPPGPQGPPGNSDANAYQMRGLNITGGDASGNTVPNYQLEFFGNSIEAVDGYRAGGFIQDGSFPIAHYDIPVLATVSMTCVYTASPASEACTIPVNNTNGFFQANLWYTIANSAPDCLGGEAFPVTSTTATSVTFNTLVGGNSNCGTGTYTVYGIFTDSYTKCAQTGGLLANFVSGNPSLNPDCPYTELKTQIQAAINAGITPIPTSHEYLWNDVRQGATSYAQALALEKQVFSMLETDFPGYPKALVCENNSTGYNDGFVVPAPMTTTSGAITAGTNTVTVSAWSNSLWGGPGVPFPITFSTGAPFQLTTSDNAETVNIISVNVPLKQITFTNTNSHASGFQLTPTVQVASQVGSNIVHEVCRAMHGTLNLVAIADTQEEIFGRLSAGVYDIYHLNAENLHPSFEGQRAQGNRLAQDFGPIVSNPEANRVRVGMRYTAPASTSELNVSNATLASPDIPSFDTKFNYLAAAEARGTSFTNPDLYYPLASEDLRYNDLLGTGSIFASSATTLTITWNGSDNHSIQTGDKVCLIGTGCFTPTSLVAAANYPSGRMTLTFNTGANPYPTNVGVFFPQQAVAVMRPKMVSVASTPYLNSPYTYTNNYRALVVANPSANSLTIRLISRIVNGGYAPLEGRTASQLSTGYGDFLAVGTIANLTIPSTVTTAPATPSTTLYPTDLTLTDTASSFGTTWNGALVDIYSTNPPDAAQNNTFSKKSTALNFVVPPGPTTPTTGNTTVLQPNCGFSCGLAASTTYYYQIQSFNAIGHALPSPVFSGTTAAGSTTQFFFVDWNLTPGALYTEIFRSTSSTPLSGGLIGTLYANAAGCQVGGGYCRFSDLGTVTPGVAPVNTNTSNGNIVDQNATVGDVVVVGAGGQYTYSPGVITGTPTVNQAACIKAAGPPVVIGYCSTVVSSSGACTCQ